MRKNIYLLLAPYVFFVTFLCCCDNNNVKNEKVLEGISQDLLKETYPTDIVVGSVGKNTQRCLDSKLGQKVLNYYSPGGGVEENDKKALFKYLDGALKQHYCNDNGDAARKKFLDDVSSDEMYQDIRKDVATFLLQPEIEKMIQELDGIKIPNYDINNTILYNEQLVKIKSQLRAKVKEFIVTTKKKYGLGVESEEELDAMINDVINGAEKYKIEEKKIDEKKEEDKKVEDKKEEEKKVEEGKEEQKKEEKRISQIRSRYKASTLVNIFEKIEKDRKKAEEEAKKKAEKEEAKKKAEEEEAKKKAEEEEAKKKAEEEKKEENDDLMRIVLCKQNVVGADVNDKEKYKIEEKKKGDNKEGIILTQIVGNDGKIDGVQVVNSNYDKNVYYAEYDYLLHDVFLNNCRKNNNFILIGLNNVALGAYMFSLVCIGVVRYLVLCFKEDTEVGVEASFTNSEATEIEILSCGNNITNMRWMFYNCRKLTDLNLYKLDTTKVINMESMFANCKSLKSLDLSNFKTNKVKDMRWMFENCSSLKSLNLSNFNTSNVIYMQGMFGNCSSLESLNLYSFVIKVDANIINMFDSISAQLNIRLSPSLLRKLKDFDRSGINIVEAKKEVNIISGKIYRCFVKKKIIEDIEEEEAESIVLRKQQDENVNVNVDDNDNVTYDIKEYKGEVEKEGDIVLTKIDPAGKIDGRNVVHENHSGSVYYVQYDGSIHDVLVNGNNNVILNGLDGKQLDAYVFSLVLVDGVVYLILCFDANTKEECGLFAVSEAIGIGILSCGSNIKNMGYMFNECQGLVFVDLSGLSTTNVTNMNWMFNNCSSLTSLNLSNFKTDNVTNMSEMFADCSSLTSLNLSNFDTKNVTNMGEMFFNCTGLTSLDLSNFNTENVTDMSWMFYGCSSLTTLNLSNFVTKNVTNMGGMFYKCRKLTDLNLYKLDTTKVTNMESMFHNCESLKSLDLTNFNTSQVENMSYMFYNCTSLKDLNLSNWDTSAVTNMSYMFAGCSFFSSLRCDNFSPASLQKAIDLFTGIVYVQCFMVSGVFLNFLIQRGKSSLGEDYINVQVSLSCGDSEMLKYSEENMQKYICKDPVMKEDIVYMCEIYWGKKNFDKDGSIGKHLDSLPCIKNIMQSYWQGGDYENNRVIVHKELWDVSELLKKLLIVMLLRNLYCSMSTNNDYNSLLKHDMRNDIIMCVNGMKLINNGSYCNDAYVEYLTMFLYMKLKNTLCSLYGNNVIENNDKKFEENKEEEKKEAKKKAAAEEEENKEEEQNKKLLKIQANYRGYISRQKFKKAAAEKIKKEKQNNEEEEKEEEEEDDDNHISTSVKKKLKKNSFSDFPNITNQGSCKKLKVKKKKVQNKEIKKEAKKKAEEDNKEEERDFLDDFIKEDATAFSLHDEIIYNSYFCNDVYLRHIGSDINIDDIRSSRQNKSKLNTEGTYIIALVFVGGKWYQIYCRNANSKRIPKGGGYVDNHIVSFNDQYYTNDYVLNNSNQKQDDISSAQMLGEEYGVYGLFGGSTATRIEILQVGTKVEDIENMFKNCDKLEFLDLSGFIYYDAILKFTNIFCGAFSLEKDILLRANVGFISVNLNNNNISISKDSSRQVRSVLANKSSYAICDLKIRRTYIDNKDENVYVGGGSNKLMIISANRSNNCSCYVSIGGKYVNEEENLTNKIVDDKVLIVLPGGQNKDTIILSYGEMTQEIECKEYNFDTFVNEDFESIVKVFCINCVKSRVGKIGFYEISDDSLWDKLEDYEVHNNPQYDSDPIVSKSKKNSRIRQHVVSNRIHNKTHILIRAKLYDDVKQEERRYIIYCENANSVVVNSKVFGLFEGSRAVEIKVLSCGTDITDTRKMFYNCKNLKMLDLSCLLLWHMNDYVDMFKYVFGDGDFHFQLVGDKKKCIFIFNTTLLAPVNDVKIYLNVAPEFIHTEKEHANAGRVFAYMFIYGQGDEKNERVLHWEVKSPEKRIPNDIVLSIPSLGDEGKEGIKLTPYTHFEGSDKVNAEFSKNTYYALLKEGDELLHHIRDDGNGVHMFYLSKDGESVRVGNDGGHILALVTYYIDSKKEKEKENKEGNESASILNSLFSFLSSSKGSEPELKPKVDKSKINLLIYCIGANSRVVKDDDKNGYNVSCVGLFQGGDATEIKILSCGDNIINMRNMFYNCKSLTSLDVSNLNTKNVKNMSDMFFNCSSLESLDLSNFNTRNVTTMENMFSNCESLKSIDLSHFNTMSIKNVKGMFRKCSKLIRLNLYNFNICNHKLLYDMFVGWEGEQGVEIICSHEMKASFEKMCYEIEDKNKDEEAKKKEEERKRKEEEERIKKEEEERKRKEEEDKKKAAAAEEEAKKKAAEAKKKEIKKKRNFTLVKKSKDMCRYDTSHIGGDVCSFSFYNKNKEGRYSMKHNTMSPNMTVSIYRASRICKIKIGANIFYLEREDCRSGIFKKKIDDNEYATIKRFFDNNIVSCDMICALVVETLENGDRILLFIRFRGESMEFASISNLIIEEIEFLIYTPVKEEYIWRMFSEYYKSLKNSLKKICFNLCNMQVSEDLCSFLLCFFQVGLVSLKCKYKKCVNENFKIGVERENGNFIIEIERENENFIIEIERENENVSIDHLFKYIQKYNEYLSCYKQMSAVGNVQQQNNNVGNNVTVHITGNLLQCYIDGNVLLIDKSNDDLGQDVVSILPQGSIEYDRIYTVTMHPDFNEENKLKCYYIDSVKCRHESCEVRNKIKITQKCDNKEGVNEVIITYNDGNEVVDVNLQDTTKDGTQELIAPYSTDKNVFFVEINNNNKGLKKIIDYITESNEEIILENNNGYLFAIVNVRQVGNVDKRYLVYYKNANSINDKKGGYYYGVFQCSRANEIKIIRCGDGIFNMHKMFADCTNLQVLNLEKLKTKNAIDMSYMFYRCESLSGELRLNHFISNHVVYMSWMFAGCKNLRKIDVSSFNTSNVINMAYMFSGCIYLTEVNVSGFNTRNVTDMSWMFYDCISLEKLDLSNFNTTQVTNMEKMFAECTNLTYLNLSYFVINNVNNDEMFSDCFKDGSRVEIICQRSVLRDIAMILDIGENDYNVIMHSVGNIAIAQNVITFSFYKKVKDNVREDDGGNKGMFSSYKCDIVNQNINMGLHYSAYRLFLSDSFVGPVLEYYNLMNAMQNSKLSSYIYANIKA